MVCEELDQLEWDFIQARAARPGHGFLGWTDREFSCLDAILDQKRVGHQGERCPRGLKSIHRSPMGRSLNVISAAALAAARPEKGPYSAFWVRALRQPRVVADTEVEPPAGWPRRSQLTVCP